MASPSYFVLGTWYFFLPPQGLCGLAGVLVYGGGMGLSIKLSESGGVAPQAVPYMPAGECVIDASVNGVPGRRTVRVTREGCERLQRDLEEHLAAAAQRKKARPLVMFDHNVQGGGAAVPKRFVWDEGRGILLEVEWTAAGREAVEGGVYGYISPSFRLQRSTGEILGLAGGVEVGSLVNDPAFEGNECIAAGREEVDEVVVHAASSTLPPRGEGENVGVLVDNKGSSGDGAGVVKQKQNKTMEEIAKLLGLPADADSAAICAKIAALQNQGATDKKRIEEVEAEKEKHKKALHEHKEASADAFVERVKKEGKIAPHDKERLAAARAMYMADAAGAECIFAGMKRVDNVREEAAGGADKVQAGAKRDYKEFTLAELLAAENEG